MIPTTNKQLVEARYGRPITDAEYTAALEYATMKLNFQSELFHREYDTAYLTAVVAEQVNQNRLDALYADIARLQSEALAAKHRYEAMDEQGIKMGLTKIAARPGQKDNGGNSFSNCPHYSTVPTTMQYMGV